MPRMETWRTLGVFRGCVSQMQALVPPGCLCDLGNGLVVGRLAPGQAILLGGEGADLLQILEEDFARSSMMPEDDEHEHADMMPEDDEHEHTDGETSYKSSRTRNHPRFPRGKPG